MGRVRDIVAGRPGNKMIGHSGDVRETSFVYFFKIQLANILNLLWQVTQDFTVICDGEKFIEQHSG